MGKKSEKAILDRMERDTQTMRSNNFTKMMTAEIKRNNLLKKIADGDTSEETKQKLKEAEEELNRASENFHNSRYY